MARQTEYPYGASPEHAPARGPGSVAFSSRTDGQSHAMLLPGCFGLLDARARRKGLGRTSLLRGADGMPIPSV